jgi:hypothetical protein
MILVNHDQLSNMKEKLIKFIKIYLAFILVALLINLTMEIVIPTPEEKDAVGIAMFYLMFSLPGSLILLFKNYRPLVMGLLSFVIGFLMEFAFMRPDWVMKIYSLTVGPGEIVAFIVSAVYWFIPWGIPAFILQRYIIKETK